MDPRRTGLTAALLRHEAVTGFTGAVRRSAGPAHPSSVRNQRDDMQVE